MKGLVEDRSMQNAKSDRFWAQVNRTMEDMMRSGWDPNKDPEGFDARLQEIIYGKFPERKPPEKPQQQQEQSSYNPIPSRMPAGRHGMMIHNNGYM